MTNTKSRRSNGKGTEYQESHNGGKRWVAEVRIDGKLFRARAKTKTDAMARRAAKVDEYRAGRPEPTTMTLGQLLADWFDKRVRRADPAPARATREGKWWAVTVLTDHLGQRRLVDLDGPMIEDAMSEIVWSRDNGKPLSKSSMKLMRTTLNQALNYGLYLRVLTVNPIPGVPRPADAAEPAVKRSLTPEQTVELWKALGDDEVYGPLYRFQLLTGVRPGESQGVLWSDVQLDGDRPTYDIRHAVNSEGHGDRLKNRPSRRTIVLSPGAVALLREQRKSVAARRLAATSWDDSLDLVFPNADGAPVSARIGRDQLAKACERAGIDVFKPHELRHTWVTTMLADGKTLRQVSQAIGHSEERTTTRVYDHTKDSAIDTGPSSFDMLADHG